MGNSFVLASISIYLIVLLAIGYYSGRKIHNIADFFVAGRRLSFPLATATLFATWFGAGTCMGAAGVAYTDGVLGVLADPYAAGLALIISGIFYVHLLRRMELLTVTDIFGTYYGTKSEIAASCLMVPTYIGWLGSQMVAVGYILKATTGMAPQTGIIIAAVIVIIYTMSGGMWAVVLTDAIQMLVLVAGLFLLFSVTMEEIGGVGLLLKATPGEFLRFIPHESTASGWVSYTGQWLICGLGCVVGQDLIQRSLSSKNESVARTSAISAGVLYILFGSIPVLLGLAGRLLVPGLEDPEQVIPSLALKFFSPVWMALFLGALISMIMSSADSSLLAGTSLVTNNIILRIYPGLSSARLLLLARWVTFTLAVLAMVIALYVKEIYGLMINSWATLLVGVLVPVTGALYWKRANSVSAWTSMICGTLTWILFIFLNGATLQDVSDLIYYQAAVYGFLAALAGYFIPPILFGSIWKSGASA